MPASRPRRSIPPGVASGNVILVPVVVPVTSVASASYGD
ncbi:MULTISPECIES: chaplin family protein [unclassified Streptomyces]